MGNHRELPLALNFLACTLLYILTPVPDLGFSMLIIKPTNFPHCPGGIRNTYSHLMLSKAELHVAASLVSHFGLKIEVSYTLKFITTRLNYVHPVNVLYIKTILRASLNVT